MQLAATLRIASLVLGLAVVAHAQGPQLLANPEFEAPFVPVAADPTCAAIGGDVASWWFDNSCWPGNQSAVVAYADEPGSPFGGTSQRVACGGGVTQLAQGVALERGTRYTLSLRARSSAGQTITVSLRKADAPYTQYVSETVTLSDAWTELRAEGFTAETAGFFLVRTSDPGTLWLDDASLVARPELAPGRRRARKPTPAALFGMHLHRSDLPWPALGPHLAGVRVWDADGPSGGGVGAQWANVNPALGTYDWSSLDQHVARAVLAGGDVLFVLGRTPQWASARPNEPSVYGPGQAAEPASLDVWRAWVQAVGTRYQGQVTHWEVWNEPNDAQFYTGSIATLVELAKVARDVLRGIDPNNVLVTPSAYDLAWLDRYLAAGGGAHADVLGYHFYLFDEAPEYLWESYVPNVLLAAERHGVGHLPLWNTEAGWWAPPALPVDLGVAYLARAYLLNRAAGVERWYFYSWDGLADAGVAPSIAPGFVVPSEAGVAYREVAAWLVGARVRQVQVDGAGVWRVRLERTGSAPTHVAWHPDGAFAFTPPATWNATVVRDLDGTTTPLAGATQVVVDRRPRLFE